MLALFTSLPARAEALTVSIGYLPVRFWWIGATLWAALIIALLILWAQRRRNRAAAVPLWTPPHIDLLRGDITHADVDAIVNAAKPSLLGGGGVDGAIHAAAGPSLLAECRELRKVVYPNGLPTGKACTTEAGDLSAKWVIHTVGPDQRIGQTDPALLRSCYRNALAEADRMGAKIVAFPLISSGVYGWDTEDAIRQALTALSTAPTRVRLVELYLFDQRSYDIAERVQTEMGL